MSIAVASFNKGIRSLAFLPVYRFSYRRDNNTPMLRCAERVCKARNNRRKMPRRRYLKKSQDTAMKKRKECICVLTIGLMLLAVTSAGAQNGQTFKARLSTVAVDATMLPTVTGSGSAKAVLMGNTLMISGSFQGLRSPATRASIHSGPQKGIPGPAVHDLTVSKDKAGSVSGSAELTASELDDLKNGRLYVQIDSERAPDGNLWGWILR